MKNREILEIYKVFADLDPCLSEDNTGCKWVIRFEFDKQKMINKNINGKYLSSY